jgi:hypothetical protein
MDKIQIFTLELRDYFAGQAATGLLACPKAFTDDNGNFIPSADPKFIATVAFRVADAMMKEKEKKNG